MKYASIDIETTGLNKICCDVIEIGIVLDDLKDPKPLSELKRWHTYVNPRFDNAFTGEPFALSMHSEIFRRIANKEAPYTYLEQDEVGEKMSIFLEGHHDGKVLAAGKNFASFDKMFLESLPEFDDWVTFHHRPIDPTMFFCNLLEDSAPPSTKTCMERAGIIGEVQHTALEDALDVVKLIRVAAFGTIEP